MNFSPCGDYFCSAGIDSVVMVWKSNLNETESEIIEDINGVGGVPVQPSPGLTGGIQSNRKPKTSAAATQQISAVPAKSNQNARYNLAKP